jgi:hypothetical protein
VQTLAAPTTPAQALSAWASAAPSIPIPLVLC